MVSAIISVVGLGLVVCACVLSQHKHSCSVEYYKYLQDNKKAPPDSYGKSIEEWYWRGF